MQVGTRELLEKLLEAWLFLDKWRSAFCGSAALQDGWAYHADSPCESGIVYPPQDAHPVRLSGFER